MLRAVIPATVRVDIRLEVVHTRVNHRLHTRLQNRIKMKFRVKVSGLSVKRFISQFTFPVCTYFRYTGTRVH